MIHFEEILEKVEAYNPNFDEDLLRRAYVFSAREHRGQVRRSGEPYLVHPLNVASILADLKADDVSIVVGLLHDVLEDTLTSKEAIAQQFGPEVAELVDGLTKIGKFSYVSREEEQAETFRKMILAMISDLRVVMVKLADRLHNMRTLGFLPEARRREVARETLDIYAPIAHRLGMGSVKGELEDLAFLYLEPEEHERVAREVVRRMKVSEAMTGEIRRRIEARLTDAGITADVSSRMKRYYSIWLKMKRTGVDAAQLYDILAFRIVVSETKDCYAALGMIHQLWRPVPGRIKDYIAMPKPNFYQSLHTTVIGEAGQPFEIQIRTREMDLIAERGIAAHWKYKEGRLGPHADDARFQWLRQLVDWQSEVSDPRTVPVLAQGGPLSRRGLHLHAQGRGVRVPARGHADRLRLSRAHGRGPPLRGRAGQRKARPAAYAAPERRHHRDPDGLQPDALSGTGCRRWPPAGPGTRSATSSTSEEKRQAVELGRRLLERELKKYKRTIKKLDADGSLGRELPTWGFSKPEDLFAAIGYGKLAPRTALERFVPAEELARPEGEKKESAVSRVVRKILPFGTPDIVVVGHNDLLATLAKCCNPVPGEKILGYVTRGRGVSVHSESCPNVKNLLYDPGRQIDVTWAGEKKASYAIELEVATEDRPGLLADVTQAIAGEGSNIRRIEARVEETREATVSVSLETSDLKQLEKIVARIRAIAGVKDVVRKYNVPKAGERE